MKILLLVAALLTAALAHANPSFFGDGTTAATPSGKGHKDGGTDDEEDRA